jgi:hypothetical protein
MRVLSDSDYKLFERLVSLSQNELKKAMAQYLKAKYDKVIFTKDYLVAVGDIPIALVAHLDTVYKTPVSNLYYDQRKGVLWSPDGLGADDRAGVFAILKILQDGYRPSVIFTTDEEKGGLGASTLAMQDCPIPNLKYMIELDRRGSNDCVFYDCYCPEFVDYVESFGFCEKYGSFSDISFLMGEWLICGVNLSVGYEEEHSYAEHLYVGPLFDTIKKVKKMLDEKDIPDFEYDELNIAASAWWKTSDTVYGQHCSKCKKLFMEEELFPVKGLDGKKKYYCPDCIVGNVSWCNICQEAYEIADPADDKKMCKECAEGLCTKTSESSLNQ